MIRIKIQISHILLLIFLAFPLIAGAATRTVYYSQSGTSVVRTASGIKNAVNNVACSLVMLNQSSVSQNYSITPKNSVSGSQGTGAITTTGDALSGSISATTGVKNFTWTFATFPAGVAGNQDITCAGTITVSDPAGTNPGFISVGGSMVTFVESGQMQTSGVTMGSVFSGLAVFMQTPIVINRGRPF